jgi:two-component system response regulator (stage 0 sporulation protein F)
METNSDSESALDTAAAKRPAKFAVRRSRVLIAEDDWDFRDMLLFAFEDQGCDVVAVGDGASFLDVLASTLLPKSPVKPFDLVVSDIRMPRWRGLADLEALSHSPRVPPIVVITAFGSDEVHEQAERAGVVAVLDKPFDIADLTALGRRVISQRAA